MAFKAGKTSHILMDSVAGSPVDISALIDTVSFPQPVDTHEVTTFGNDDKQFIVGLANGGQISFSGPHDVALGTFVSAVKAAHSAGSASSTFTYSPGGSVSGQLKVEAEVYVTAFGPSSGVGGRVEYQGSLQVTGAVANTTW